MQKYKLKIKQLDKALNPWHSIAKNQLCKNNWFQTIREALGIPTRYLAKKMGLSPGRIVQLQTAEIDGSITLKNLRKAAENLDCMLIYAFVPKKPLKKIVEEQAKNVANQIISSVNHTMGLEEQAVTKSELKEHCNALADELSSGNPKNLWKN